MMIDLFEHRVAVDTPQRLTHHSFWQEHIPFGMFMVSALKPRVLVELGTHYGESYCAFCQAVQTLDLKTLCYAVDNWQGDIHYGQYGGEVLANLREHHDPRYERFSMLLRSDFMDALNNFKDGSIDLLHIDGTHTYEAVKRDFEAWLPKMSTRGVVMFHDTNVFQENFGVRQFFDEVKANSPHFEFLHCYGLGVLGVGVDFPDEVNRLFKLSTQETLFVRDLFAALGGALTQRVEAEKQQAEVEKQQAEAERQRLEIEEQRQRMENALKELAAAQRAREEMCAESTRTAFAAQAQQSELTRALGSANENLEKIVNSRGWQLLQGVWWIKRKLKS